MEQLLNIQTKYLEAGYKRDADITYNNELKYVEAAINYLRVFPDDRGGNSSVLLFKEDEIEYLLRRRELLLFYGELSADFLQLAASLFYEFPLSYCKHSFFVDFLTSEKIGEAYRLIFLKPALSFSRFKHFECYAVALFLYHLNKDKDLSLHGIFWNLEEEIVASESENRIGYFEGYKPML